MKIEPIVPIKADRETADLYKKIKDIFNIHSVPLAFQYIAPFRNYFKYLVSKIEESVLRDDFISLSKETKLEVESLFKENITLPLVLRKWREKNRDKSLSIIRQGRRILDINTKLVFVFIALRESVKSWSLSGKITSISTHEKTRFKFRAVKDQTRDFIYKEVIDEVVKLDAKGKITERDNKLLEYMSLSQGLFQKWQKEEEYLFFRLTLEKLFLLKMNLLFNFIHSPINVVIPLVREYPHYDELLYLLLDHFPTFSMQKLLFSLYLT